MLRLFAFVGLVFAGGLGSYALAVPALEAGGGGGGCPVAPRDGADEPVVIEHNCFTPVVLFVEPGSTVEWQAKDGDMPHNVKLFDGELVGGGRALLEGDTVERTFDTAGVYGYYCEIHPSMIGVVAVGEAGEGGFTLQTTPERREELEAAAATFGSSYAPGQSYKGSNTSPNPTTSPEPRQPQTAGPSVQSNHDLVSDTGRGPALVTIAGAALVAGLGAVAAGVLVTRRR